MNIVKKTELALNGGKPVRGKPWPSYAVGSSLLTKAQLRKAHKVLAGGRYFRYDDRGYEETYTGRYENKLREFFGVKHVLAVSNGTSALAISLMASGIPAGSVVACPSFTFAATPSAILLAGCKPLLIECDENLHIDFADLQQKYTPEMKAIIPVHMRGMAENMPVLQEFAREKKLIVIEDCAAACGVELQGKKLGTFGDAGAFSTQAGKFINTGEGGFLITNSDEIYNRALAYSGAYVPGFYQHCTAEVRDSKLPIELPLYNFRFDEIRSALGITQIKQIPKILARQRKNYEWVANRLSKLENVKLRQALYSDAVSGYGLMFRLPGIGVEKITWVVEALRAEGIGAKAFADPTTLNQRAFWNWHFLNEEISLPNSARYLSEVIDIALFANLTKKDLQELICAVEKVLHHL